MCHVSCIVFGAKYLSKDEVKGKKVLEVGSHDVNGSLRPIIESWEPAEYIGVDIKKGPGVDVICNADNIVEHFGKETFDIVISTELLEHVWDWRRVISNIKNICKSNGIILITTRSYGFPYHAYPYDFWRYELEDMKNIFSDCELMVLENDFQAPGVFIKVTKPTNFGEKDLARCTLYSVVVNTKVREITDVRFRNVYFVRLVLKEKIKNFILKVRKVVFHKI